jgi:hypothetical protein
MISLNATDDLKTLVEKAFVNLLCADPVLEALNPSQNEYYGDDEPDGNNAGQKRNPLLHVKASGAGTAFAGTQFRKIKIECTIELEPNEITAQVGIAPYFKRMEDILDNYALHTALNAVNSSFFVCEGTYSRDPGDASHESGSGSAGKWKQTYAMEGIFIAQ